MKALFLILVIALRVSSSFASIHVHYDSSAQMSYVNITPLKWSHNDTTNVTRLYCRVFGDNLSNSAELYYELHDSLGNVASKGNAWLNGADYSDWQSDNDYPFTYLADSDILNVIIIN